MKTRRDETFEVLDDVILPEAVRGRPRTNDAELIDLARKGRASGKYTSRNHAARELAKDAEGNSRVAKERRLNSKFKRAGID
jgi:hypothetical protein